MSFNNESFLKKGFVNFNLKDFDLVLYNHLYQLTDKQKFFNLINHLRYEFSVINTEDLEPINKICEKYINNFSIDNNNIRINGTFKNNFEDFILLFDKLKNYSKNVFQHWFYTNLSENFMNGNNSNYQNEIIKLVNEIHKKILINFYNILENQFKYNHMIDLTLYTKNSFIVPHEDGYDEGRLCVILIYLNEDYEKGFGGELKINDNFIVRPNFGEITILDFTKNNPKHEVLSVINDNFHRYAFIKFFYLQDILN